MTSKERCDRIQRVLWPPQQRQALEVWAVLDGARDARIHRALSESRLEFLCLYSGRLAPDLERAAPQLVQLWPDHRLTLRLLDEGWGQSWGILVKIADSSNLRHHLRTLLRVQDEARRRLLFRFYDPRVMRAFLPTCRSDELRQVLGPIDSLILEGDGGDELIEYRRQAGVLQRSVVELPVSARV